MNPDFHLLRWYGKGPGLLSLGLVLLTAIWLAVWASGVLVSPATPTYYLDFGHARWIAPPEAKSTGYFRKDIYIPSAVRHAWVEVAATDSVMLFINNKPVRNPNPLAVVTTTAVLPSGCPTAVVDITTYLREGSNTLAAYVLRGTYTGPLSLKVRGEIFFFGGGSQEILSDTTWRASTYPGVLSNLIEWTDPTVDDQQWPAAVPGAEQPESLIQPVTVPPWLVEQPLDAHWIGAFPATARSVSFARDFSMPLGATDAWLQISAIGRDMVMVNGQTVIDSTPPQGDPGTLAPIPNLHFYWIGPWLNAGHNHVEVRVISTEPDSPPQTVAEIAWKNASGTVSTVPTDHLWTQNPMMEGRTVDRNAEALELTTANYAGLNWGIPASLSYPDTYSATESTHRLIWRFIVGFLIAGCVLVAHIAAADYFVRRGIRDSGAALSLDATLHVPILFFLLLFAILPYEIRLRPEWCLQPGWLLFLILGWLGIRWFAGRDPQPLTHRYADQTWANWASGRGFAVLLGVIVAISFVLRLVGINLFALDQDEVFICNCAHGIWYRGYPSLTLAGVSYRLTTYEILPYPIALSAVFFGWTDWSVRIPALIFGTLTTWQLGRFGRELFSWRVGLLAALVHTFNPFDVYWARHCFHPAQAQFMALLCFRTFYRAILVPGVIDRREFYKLCIFFPLLYLTWEGSAFLLPSFVFTLLLMHPGKWAWLRSFHVYAGLIFVIAVVVLQLVNRSVLSPSYLFLGYGLASLTPQLTFLNQTSDSAFYIETILETQCHLLLALTLLFGAFFIAKRKPLRYVLVLFGVLLFSYSNLLPAYSTRYFYFYQTLLILGAVAVLDEVGIRLAGLWDDVSLVRRGRFVRFAWAGIVATILLSSTTRGLLLYRLQNGNLPSNTVRFGLNWQDARPVCEYVASHVRPGDRIAGGLSQSYNYFTGKSMDYTPNLLLSYRCVFDPNKPHFGGYENIYTHIGILRNEREVEDILAEGQRIWYIGYLPPSGGNLIRGSLGALSKYSREVYSSANVTIYLCEGITQKAAQIAEDPGLPPNPLIMLNDESTVTPGYVKDSFATPGN